MKFIHQSCCCFHKESFNGAHKTFIVFILYSGLVTFSNLNENNNLNSKAINTSKKHPILTTTNTTKEISSGTYVFSNLNENQGPRQIPIIDDENSSVNSRISTSTTRSKPTSTTTPILTITTIPIATTSTTKEISSGTYVFSNLNEYQGPRQIPIIDDENSSVDSKISTSKTSSKPTSTTTETTPYNFRVCARRKALDQCLKNLSFFFE